VVLAVTDKNKLPTSRGLEAAFHGETAQVIAVLEDVEELPAAA